MVFVTIFNEYQERKHRLFEQTFLKNVTFFMASFDEFMSLVRLLLNLVGKYCKMYSKKLKFSTLLN
jgi:uncharacterized membrane protein YqjE